MCLKELILIESLVRMRVAFAITATFLKQISGFGQKYTMVVMIYCKRL